MVSDSSTITFLPVPTGISSTFAKKISPLIAPGAWSTLADGGEVWATGVSPAQAARAIVDVAASEPARMVRR